MNLLCTIAETDGRERAMVVRNFMRHAKSLFIYYLFTYHGPCEIK